MNVFMDWSRHPHLDPTVTLEAASARLREILAILSMIEDAELLSELPQAPHAMRRHQTGVSLLGVMSRELQRLIDELDAAAGGV